MKKKPIDLRAFRLANNITQGELAEYLGVTRGFISAIENGRANLPDKKIDYLLEMAKKDKSWDTTKLTPDSSRLTTIATMTYSKKKPPLDLQERFGISEEIYYKIMNARAALSPTVIEQLTEKNPNLNPEWLATGKGNQYLFDEKRLSSDYSKILINLQTILSKLNDIEKKLEVVNIS